MPITCRRYCSSDTLSASAVHKTNDYLCKGHDHPDDDWHYAMDTGSDWAEAYARAIADVTVDCYASAAPLAIAHPCVIQRTRLQLAVLLSMDPHVLLSRTVQALLNCV